MTLKEKIVDFYAFAWNNLTWLGRCTLFVILILAAPVILFIKAALRE
jgi:hypothetical protein